jgi:hypothetical protein
VRDHALGVFGGRSAWEISPVNDNGIGLYRYRYVWSDQVYVGVITVYTVML